MRDHGSFPFPQSQRTELVQGGNALALERRLGIQAQAREMDTLEKGGDQAKLCKVQQNGTQDLQGKSPRGIDTWQYCSGLGMLLCRSPWSWCIICHSGVMASEFACSSKFLSFPLLGGIKS